MGTVWCAMLLALMSLFTPAAALTSNQAGPSFDLAAGLGLGGGSINARGAGQLSVGGWAGRYDDSFAIGRYWWFGATGRADWRPGLFIAAPLAEIRRGVDVIVAGAYWGAALGPVLAVGSGPTSTGLAARAVGGAKFRRTRYFSFTARIEAGADLFAGRPTFAGAVLLGVAFARPGSAQKPSTTQSNTSPSRR